ncbi:hypothetical protein ABZ639_00020 [Saccharomonospora sp. NPDC006951]
MHDDTNPAPRPVPGPPPGMTGPAPQDTDPRAGIEEAIAGLEGLADLPLAEHVERFDTVHTELAVALSSIDKV